VRGRRLPADARGVKTPQAQPLHAGANRERILAYEDAHRGGDLRHRVYFMVRGADVFAGFKAAGVYTGFGDEWVRVGGVKFAADGSASERTMRMSTPYVGTNDYGILTMTQKEIFESVEDAHRHDFQVGVHANGDVAIDMVLKAYEHVLGRWPAPDRRHRIEHCSLVTDDLLRPSLWCRSSSCRPLRLRARCRRWSRQWS